LSEYNTPVLRCCVTQRVIFAEAAAKGCAVYEVDAQGPAAKDIDNLVNEIKEFS
jgi:chromosome partitioning protein